MAETRKLPTILAAIVASYSPQVKGRWFRDAR